jgi:hypothetical protein
LTRFLDDLDKEDRQTGIDTGLVFLKLCKEVWAFTVDGRISSGMRAECLTAFGLGIPVKWFAYKESPLRIITDDVTPLNLPADRFPEEEQVRAPAEAQQRLAALAEKLRAGENYADFEDAIDVILGTTMEPRDSVVEEIWEHSKED